jgi:hypothetical protein
MVGAFISISNLNRNEIMNKKISIGLGVFALTLMLGVGASSVMAADTSSSSAPFISRCGQSIQKGYGMISDTIIKLLGMSQEQIQTEREAGKSIVEIAQEKNINEQTLIGSMLEARKQNLQEAVSNGYLTQKQADERLEWMNERIKGQAENGGGRFGHGGCGGGCHQ